MIYVVMVFLSVCCFLGGIGLMLWPGLQALMLNVSILANYQALPNALTALTGLIAVAASLMFRGVANQLTY